MRRGSYFPKHLDMRVGQKIQMLQTYINILLNSIPAWWILDQQTAGCKMERNWGGEEVVGIRIKVARQQEE